MASSLMAGSQARGGRGHGNGGGGGGRGGGWGWTEAEGTSRLPARQEAEVLPNKGKKKKKKKKGGESGGQNGVGFGDVAGQELEASPPPVVQPDGDLLSAMQGATIGWGEVDCGDEIGWPAKEEQLLGAGSEAPNGVVDRVARSEESGWEVAGSRKGRKGRAPLPPSVGEGVGSGSGKAGNGWGGKSFTGGRSGGHGKAGKHGKNGRSNGRGSGASEGVADGWEADPQSKSSIINDHLSEREERAAQHAWGNAQTGWEVKPNVVAPQQPRGGETVCAWKTGKKNWGEPRESFPSLSSQAASQVVEPDYPVSALSESQYSEDELQDDSDYVSGDSNSEDEYQPSKKWFQPFFDDLRNLSAEQLSEHDRQWHCPACKGGVGAIDWYRGLQPLLTHAQTIRAKRVKLHRHFAGLLEDELRQRGAGTSSSVGGKFGKWKGLRDSDEAVNPLVLWPPMVVIQNTQLELDEQDKWVGMGNQELLDHFREYNCLKARHAYGPQGHRGMSILMFADSPSGFYDSQRLDKAFRDARRGRDDWYRPSKSIFEPGSSGQRILYGYMASKEDVEQFNRHGRGKLLIKCELKRLNEVVVQPMRQQDEEMNRVTWLKDKVQQAQVNREQLEETVYSITRQLKLREEEIREVIQKAQELTEKNKQEMDDLEKFYQDKVDLYEAKLALQEEEEQRVREAFKLDIQVCQQLEKEASKLDSSHTSQQEQHQRIEAELARQSNMVKQELKQAEEYEARKNAIQQQYHLSQLLLKQEQYEKRLALEQQLESERSQNLDLFKKANMMIRESNGFKHA